MKIYIHVGKTPISGYLNINLGTDNLDLNNLDQVCEAAECIELVLDDILQYIPLQQIPLVIQKLATRLRKQAKLTIVSNDVNSCINMYKNGRMSLADLNLVLYGVNNIKKISCISHTDITKLIEQIGLKIISVEISGEKFIIVAQRV